MAKSGAGSANAINSSRSFSQKQFYRIYLYSTWSIENIEVTLCLTIICAWHSALSRKKDKHHGQGVSEIRIG